MEARHVLVLGDSLSFHGPDQPYRPSDPRLYPNVMAAALAEALGTPVHADLVARIGWTARDAWWALTKDPNVWGELRAARRRARARRRADGPPARRRCRRGCARGSRTCGPAALRRRVRRAYDAASPHVIRATGGRDAPAAAGRHRPLPRADRRRRAHLPPGHPGRAARALAVRGAVVPLRTVTTTRPSPPAAAWASAHGAGFVDLDPIVAPSLAAGTGNPDGMHWGWEVARRHRPRRSPPSSLAHGLAGPDPRRTDRAASPCAGEPPVGTIRHRLAPASALATTAGTTGGPAAEPLGRRSGAHATAAGAWTAELRGGASLRPWSTVPRRRRRRAHADVLDDIDLAEVLALRLEGTEPDRRGQSWSRTASHPAGHRVRVARRPARTDRDGASAHAEAARARWWIAFACFVLPMHRSLRGRRARARRRRLLVPLSCAAPGDDPGAR